MCDPRLLENMIVNKPNWNNSRLPVLILTITMTLAILAAAGPSWRQQSYPIMESTHARVVALDLSSSMRVRDVEPNRIEHAISAARELLSADFDGETGLVVFAGSAFVVSPLSRDAKTLLAFLDALDPSVMPLDGTRIDLAIEAARGLLEASFTGTGQILIVTAGTTKSTTAVQASLVAVNQGHRVSVFAIGSDTGGPQVDQNGRLVRDEAGKYTLSKTNFELLERVARVGKGSIVTMKEYQGYDNPIVSRMAANELVESEQATDNSQRTAANDGVWLIWLMLPFALLLFRKNLVWIILLGVMIPDDRELHAKEWNSFWNHREVLAFEAYQRGEYESSVVLSSNPRMQASAYYRNGQYQQALKLFGEDESAQSTYNRGNAFAQQGRFAEAIAAYQQALSLDPELGPARYNKRLIELYLEQQSDLENQQAGNSDEDDPANESPDQSDTESRIGAVGQESTNPGDDPQLGPGLGASAQSGPVDPLESIGLLDQELGRFRLRAQAEEQLPDPAFIEHWIKTLPETSTDLFRLKFLRDHQRRQRQAR